MAKEVLDEIATNIQSADLFTVMADESTDASNKEQVVVVIRWVDKSLDVHEDFIHLYNTKQKPSQE